MEVLFEALAVPVVAMSVADGVAANVCDGGGNGTTDKESGTTGTTVGGSGTTGRTVGG